MLLSTIHLLCNPTLRAIRVRQNFDIWFSLPLGPILFHISSQILDKEHHVLPISYGPIRRCYILQQTITFPQSDSKFAISSMRQSTANSHHISISLNEPLMKASQQEFFSISKVMRLPDESQRLEKNLGNSVEGKKWTFICGQQLAADRIHNNQCDQISKIA